MQNFAYLVESGGQAVSVDMAWDIKSLTQYLSSKGIKLAGGLYTRAQFDALGGTPRVAVDGYDDGVPGAKELSEALVGEVSPISGQRAKVLQGRLWIGANEVAEAAKQAGVPHGDWTPLAEGDSIDVLGSDVEIVAVDTPGHTRGGVSYFVRSASAAGEGPCADGVVFTGDTLLVNAAGGELSVPVDNPEELQRSLSRLGELPPRTVVFPARHTDPNTPVRSTVRHESRTNSKMMEARDKFPAKGLKSLPPALLTSAARHGEL